LYSQLYKYEKSQSLPYNLLNAFEAAATEDASSSGFGSEALKAQSHAWMLFRLTLNVNKGFQMSDFQVTTWPSGDEKLFVYRDYELRQRGTLVGGGSTTWLLVNLITKRPCLTDEIKTKLMKNESPPKWERAQRLKGDGEVLTEESYLISANHIDANQHLNNKWYVNFALKGWPNSNRSLKRLDVQFDREVHAGDTLICRVEKISEDRLFHKLHSSVLGQSVATLSTIWH
jgi:acyl-ACP thioesterase